MISMPGAGQLSVAPANWRTPRASAPRQSEADRATRKPRFPIDESGEFDHILLDSPPTIQVADSLILAPLADATILVVRAGMTSRESLAEGVARLR